MRKKNIEKHTHFHKKPNKKKGFTMIELLATIVILGILMVMAIVALTSVMEKGKENYNEIQKDEVRLAAESYIQNNRAKLPKVIGQKTKVTLKELVDGKYIKDVKDAKNKPCDLNRSYVTIFKYNKTNYSYSVHLVCSNNINEDVAPKPVIGIIFDENNAKVILKGDSASSTKLLSYSYKITVDGKEIYTSENKMINYKATYNFNIDTSAYKYKAIKVKVTTTNIKGGSRTVEQTKSATVLGAPTCGTITGASTNWTKGRRTISVGCIDNKVGCERKKYTKTFKATTKVGYITIKNKAGKTTNCPVNVYIDKTAPSVPTVNMYKWKNNWTRPYSTSGLAGYSNNTWSKLKVYTTASSSRDSHSGGIYYQYTTTGSTTNETNTKSSYRSIEANGTSYIKYRACDKLGNCSAYSSAKTIKVDTATPTCGSITGASTSWTRNNRTIKVACNDTGGSGCVNSSYSKTFTANAKGGTITIADKAGNSRNCSVNVYIDKTAPSTPAVYTYKWRNNWTRPSSSSGLSWYSNNTWSNLKVYTTAGGSSDNLSGVSYQYTTTGSTTNETNKSGSARNIEADGTSYIKYRACDAAGNCSPYSGTITVRIDTTPPNVPTVYTYKWRNNWTRPSSSSGLSGYSNNTWSNIKVYTAAGGSSDNISGVSYQYTTTGSTTNATNSWGSARNVEAEGTSYIKYRACDAVGNCSGYSSTKTIKIDVTPPTIQYGWCSGCRSESIPYGGGRTYTFYYYDNLSGLSSTWYAATITGGGCNSGWKAAGSSLCPSYQMSKPYYRAYKVKDNAGNMSKVICSYLNGNSYGKYGPSDVCYNGYYFYR